MSEKRYAHEVVPHPQEREMKPLEYLARYHYAQAQGWVAAVLGSGGDEIDRLAVAQFLGHAHLGLLHDALAQGIEGQEAADWAAHRHHAESAEIVWERGDHYGVDMDSIKAYEGRECHE